MESGKLEPESFLQTVCREARIEGRSLLYNRVAQHADAAAQLAQLHRHARCRRHRASGGRARRQSDRARLQRAVGRPHGASAGSAGRAVRGIVAERRSRYLDPQLGDFSWHELLTTNWQTASDFYAKLFGWEKMEAMDMGPQGTYQIFGTGGHQLGGMFNPGGLPPGGPLWIPYVMVADARRTAETAKALGATIAHGPIEVPGGDWVFTGLDRHGAMFAAHSKKRVTTKEVTTTKKTTKDTKKKSPAKRPVRSARLQASRKKPARKRR